MLGRIIPEHNSLQGFHTNNGRSEMLSTAYNALLPYDFPDQAHSNGDFLIHVLHSMTEVAPPEVLNLLASQIKNTFDLASEFVAVFSR